MKANTRICWPVFCLALLCSGWAYTAQAQVYYLYVAAGPPNEVAVMRFDSRTNTAGVVERIAVASEPAEIAGLAIDFEGTYWYVSMAYGSSSGTVVKYTTATNERVGEMTVEPSPAAMRFSPATGLLYVVHTSGDDKPGHISVVDPVAMTERARMTTDFQPHDVGLSPDGRALYSVAMMDSILYEIDTATLDVTRHLDLTSGPPAPSNLSAFIDSTDHAAPAPSSPPASNPTGVTTHPTQPFVYVANSGTDTIVEVDTETWRITRRFATEGAPYALDVASSPDGIYLIATQAANGSTGFFNLKRGEEVVRVQNSHPGTHSVVVSTDGRYAFLSVKGTGSEAGAVDVITLDTVELVASASVGHGASSIAFWKIAGE